MTRWTAMLFVLSAAPAAAQSFNVDIGKNQLYPAPPATYGAGASQPGFWNAWAGDALMMLSAIDGTPTSARARYVFNLGGFAEVESDIPGSSAGDELLMDDRRTAKTTFGSLEDVEISGLWSGDYEVYTYAFDVGPGTTSVSVIGSPDPTVTLGSGNFPGTQIVGVTFAKHRVTTGGVITIEIDTASNWLSTINGFQLRWLPPPASGHCTAKVNSLGCVPAIASSGVPSASAGSGFFVTCANVRNQKYGLLLHGTSGSAAIPFQGGYLCVAPPVRRTPGQYSAGTPLPAADCTGQWQIDFNAFVAGALGGNPSAALSQPGAAIDAQWWGRDPPPGNSSLSAGLQFVQGF